MFDQVKQNMGKWNRQGEEEDINAPSEAVRPATSRMNNQAQGPATIGPSIRIKGDLTGEENLIIEGQIEGNIHLDKNDLTIGTNGRIKANIKAKGVIVEGQVEGDIIGKEKVIIRRTGNMRGNIVAPRVTLEDGAMFKGSIEMEPETRRGSEVEPVIPGLNKESSNPQAAVSPSVIKSGKV